MDKNLHGQIDTSECSCHGKNESSLHYLIDCFLFTGERQTLFNLVEYFTPQTMCKNDPGNPKFVHTKHNIIYCSTKFLLNQKCFLLDSHIPHE